MSQLQQHCCSSRQVSSSPSACRLAGDSREGWWWGGEGAWRETGPRGKGSGNGAWNKLLVVLLKRRGIIWSLKPPGPGKGWLFVVVHLFCLGCMVSCLSVEWQAIGRGGSVCLRSVAFLHSEMGLKHAQHLCCSLHERNGENFKITMHLIHTVPHIWWANSPHPAQGQLPSHCSVESGFFTGEQISLSLGPASASVNLRPFSCDTVMIPHWDQPCYVMLLQ